MRLARMGSFHPTRLSFMQSLLRRLAREAWRFERRCWEIDDKGVGHAVYSVLGPERAYSLVCFAHDLPDEMRSDRVIATAWDATFALFDGVPTENDIDRLARNVPKQEAGRVSDDELSLSRANRSVRLFEYVVGCLAEGRQPDRAEIDAVGYLMRTTAVYGSGKFGAADRVKIAGRPELKGPFQAEMLSVWLTRSFTLDLVEHMARVRDGAQAVTIDPDLRRRFGVGNSTGLGMAPFLINHPVLLNNWILAREEALARVRALAAADQNSVEGFRSALVRATENVALWRSEHPVQEQKLAGLRKDLDALTARCKPDDSFDKPMPWNLLWLWAEDVLSLEGQELLVSLLLEPQGDLVDDLADCMDADEDAAFRIDGSMTTQTLRGILAEVFDWALSVDYESAPNCARFWYVSEEKLEPRLGERASEEGAEYEQPLSTGRDAAQMAADLDHWQGELSVAAFLLAHPEHRHTARRAQIAARYSYAEIRDNLISSDLMPIDLLRCKLSFFGADRFDPRSDRWVRICMYRDAPFPQEILQAPR
ncbi:hypothetical protein FKG95_18550 [Denitrobaculum tricleocarpae]|uniref:Uncharacterized protein n=2 Tax=Denitrobaculum tricleocarpae TaxID=2591009 RepID=A0A545TN59_9PROT|nr:hypothetical protein FKG95_18550 [Denitrobaculum tricleocarpae]